MCSIDYKIVVVYLFLLLIPSINAEDSLDFITKEVSVADGDYDSNDFSSKHTQENINYILQPNASINLYNTQQPKTQKQRVEMNAGSCLYYFNKTRVILDKLSIMDSCYIKLLVFDSFNELNHKFLLNDFEINKDYPQVILFTFNKITTKGLSKIILFESSHTITKTNISENNKLKVYHKYDSKESRHVFSGDIAIKDKTIEGYFFLGKPKVAMSSKITDIDNHKITDVYLTNDISINECDDLDLGYKITTADPEQAYCYDIAENINIYLGKNTIRGTLEQIYTDNTADAAQIIADDTSIIGAITVVASIDASSIKAEVNSQLSGSYEHNAISLIGNKLLTINDCLYVNSGISIIGGAHHSGINIEQNVNLKIANSGIIKSPYHAAIKISNIINNSSITILNNGTISGGVHSIYVEGDNNTLKNITNQIDGLIEGTLTLSQSVINNYGTITGNFALSGNNLEINNSGIIKSAELITSDDHSLTINNKESGSILIDKNFSSTGTSDITNYGNITIKLHDKQITSYNSKGNGILQIIMDDDLSEFDADNAVFTCSGSFQLEDYPKIVFYAQNPTITKKQNVTILEASYIAFEKAITDIESILCGRKVSALSSGKLPIFYMSNINIMYATGNIVADLEWFEIDEKLFPTTENNIYHMDQVRNIIYHQLPDNMVIEKNDIPWYLKDKILNFGGDYKIASGHTQNIQNVNNHIKITANDNIKLDKININPNHITPDYDGISFVGSGSLDIENSIIFNKNVAINATQNSKIAVEVNGTLTLNTNIYNNGSIKGTYGFSLQPETSFHGNIHNNGIIDADFSFYKEIKNQQTTANNSLVIHNSFSGRIAGNIVIDAVQIINMGLISGDINLLGTESEIINYGFIHADNIANSKDAPNKNAKIYLHNVGLIAVKNSMHLKKLDNMGSMNVDTELVLSENSYNNNNLTVNNLVINNDIIITNDAGGNTRFNNIDTQDKHLIIVNKSKLGILDSINGKLSILGDGNDFDGDLELIDDTELTDNSSLEAGELNATDNYTFTIGVEAHAIFNKAYQSDISIVNFGTLELAQGTTINNYTAHKDSSLILNLTEFNSKEIFRIKDIGSFATNSKIYIKTDINDFSSNIIATDLIKANEIYYDGTKVTEGTATEIMSKLLNVAPSGSNISISNINIKKGSIIFAADIVVTSDLSDKKFTAKHKNKDYLNKQKLPDNYNNLILDINIANNNLENNTYNQIYKYTKFNNNYSLNMGSSIKTNIYSDNIYPALTLMNTSCFYGQKNKLTSGYTNVVLTNMHIEALQADAVSIVNADNLGVAKLKKLTIDKDTQLIAGRKKSAINIIASFNADITNEGMIGNSNTRYGISIENSASSTIVNLGTIQAIKAAIKLSAQSNSQSYNLIIKNYSDIYGDLIASYLSNTDLIILDNYKNITANNININTLVINQYANAKLLANNITAKEINNNGFLLANNLTIKRLINTATADIDKLIIDSKITQKNDNNISINATDITKNTITNHTELKINHLCANNNYLDIINSSQLYIHNELKMSKNTNINNSGCLHMAANSSINSYIAEKNSKLIINLDNNIKNAKELILSKALFEAKTINFSEKSKLILSLDRKKIAKTIVNKRANILTAATINIAGKTATDIIENKDILTKLISQSILVAMTNPELIATNNGYKLMANIVFSNIDIKYKQQAMLFDQLYNVSITDNSAVILGFSPAKQENMLYSIDENTTLANNNKTIFAVNHRLAVKRSNVNTVNLTPLTGINSGELNKVATIWSSYGYQYKIYRNNDSINKGHAKSTCNHFGLDSEDHKINYGVAYSYIHSNSHIEQDKEKLQQNIKHHELSLYGQYKIGSCYLLSVTNFARIKHTNKAITTQKIGETFFSYNANLYVTTLQLIYQYQLYKQLLEFSTIARLIGIYNDYTKNNNLITVFNHQLSSKINRYLAIGGKIKSINSCNMTNNILLEYGISLSYTKYIILNKQPTEVEQYIAKSYANNDYAVNGLFNIIISNKLILGITANYNLNKIAQELAASLIIKYKFGYGS